MIKNIKNIFKKQKLFYFLFNLKLWKRFSFYILQSILIIYLIKQLNLYKQKYINLFYSFKAILYSLIILLELIDNNILILKNIIFSLILLLLEYIIILLYCNKLYFIYLCLIIISISNAFLKTSTSLILSKIYKKKQNKYNIYSWYTLYYIYINILWLFSTLITPWINYKLVFKITFFFSFISLIITLIILMYYINYISKLVSKLYFEQINIIYINYLIIFFILLTIFSNLIINNIILINFIFKIIISLLFIKILEIFLYLNSIIKKIILVTIILLFESNLFFILYNLITTSLKIFKIKNFYTNIFLYNLKPEQFKSLNTLLITIFGPILSIIYNKLTLGNYIKKKVLIYSKLIIISYLLKSISKLIIYILNLFIITKLTHKKLLLFNTKLWFALNYISTIISVKIDNIMNIPQNININKFKNLNIYYKNFSKI